MMRRLSFLLVAVAACDPDLVDRTTVVDAPRLLAVRSSPAEARPREAVTFEALVAGPDGRIATDEVAWAFCTLRKPVADLGPVAEGCITGTPAEGLVALGQGPTASGAIPTDACRLFGSDTPPPKPGEPPRRPVDPDPTGGYYQPVRVAVGGRPDLAEVRVRCGLAGARPDQVRRFETESRSNTNPTLAGVWLDQRAKTHPLVPTEIDPNASLTVPAGEPALLIARWPECAATAAEGCGGSESYLYLDPATRELVPRREALRVSWFATAGTFLESRTGQGEEAAAVSETRNVFTAPTTPGTVHLWAVLRDDRGGTTWATYRLVVR